MRGTFPVCCASALAPHTVSATTIAKRPAHFRFWILDFRLSDRNERNAVRDVLVMSLAPNLKSKIENPKIYLITLSARTKT
jgi:hypothetical protein